jgi:hypothetical protein
MTMTPEAPSEALLLEIAAKHFHLETLETRNSDSLDFHDVSVWSIRAALEAAFAAGQAAARGTGQQPAEQESSHDHPPHHYLE